MKLDEKKVIYVGGPYRALTFFDREMNILRAAKVAKAIWDEGHVALCPHLNTRFFCEDGKNTEFSAAIEENILAGDLVLLAKCDAMFVLPGSEKSSGTCAEIRFAVAAGIQVFETDFALAKFLTEPKDAKTNPVDGESPDLPRIAGTDNLEDDSEVPGDAPVQQGEAAAELPS